MPVDELEAPDESPEELDFFARFAFFDFFLAGLVVSEAPELAAGLSLVALDDDPMSEVPLVLGVLDVPELVAPGMVDEPELPVAPVPDVPAALLPVVPEAPEEVSLLPEVPLDGLVVLGIAPDVLPLLPGMLLSLAPLGLCARVEGEVLLSVLVDWASAREDTDATITKDNERSVVFNFMSYSF